MHKLKKYPNRRLYDMTESRYVTVEDVRRIITSGESIEVEDSKNGDDITRSVLLQILAEQETEGHDSVLTNRAIEQIIRFYGDKMGGVVSRYIEQSIVSFLDHQEQFRSHPRQLNEMNPINLMRQALDANRQAWQPPRADKAGSEAPAHTEETPPKSDS